MNESPQYEAFLRKNEAWNFWVNTLDVTFFTLATSFIFGSTVLSLYASHLTSSAILIGLIPSIQAVGYYIPQLITASHAERAPRKKPFVQRISVMERLPYLFVTLGILFWPKAPKGVSFAILALSLALAAVSGGLATPAWQNLIAKVIRLERRGLFFGLSHALGGLLGIAGAALSRHLLTTYAFPLSFGLCFLLCFAFQVVSWTFLSLNREPAQKVVKQPIALLDYWRRLPAVLRDNPNFARYLLGRTLLILGSMGTVFYVLYARKVFQLGEAFAADLTMAALISQTVSTPLLGWLADRRGHKWLTETSAVVAVAAIITVLAAPNALWLYLVFVLLNVSSSGHMVAGMSITMEFSAPEDLPTFTALASTLLSIPILLAPVLGGWIVDLTGYRPLFLIALAFLLAGWATMRWAVREPRQQKRTAPPALEGERP